MADISDFHISEKLYESPKTVVFRAVRRSDEKPVILKKPGGEYPSAEVLSRLRREYEIIASLEGVSGIIRAQNLISDNNTLILVEEDTGSQTLSDLISQQRPDIHSCLDIALKLSEIIAHMHEHHIIHKDINPSNILWNTQNQQVTLIDFGISSLLTREFHEFQNPNQLEGTFAFLSPEQTGRVNRLLDYRSDLYSLGVTLYQLFTGVLPFTGNQGIELVHAHIAIAPTPPAEINNEIPIAISNIILRLMSKMADDRYQSAWGLWHDLDYCLDQFDSNGDIRDFELGKKDFSPLLQIPQKLYGREQELDTILKAFERVSQGGLELCLVSGYSGTGKSALVHEVHKPLTACRGLFVSGKFDQFQRDVPLYAWRRVIEEFSQLLLKESKEDLAIWRELIADSMGSIGKVITDLAPSLELIIGKQPDVPVLSGEQALNRFNYVFQQFFTKVSTREHPLVIFIDDWQWADAASINLLKQLMQGGANQYLLVICAWRDNEVTNTHPFAVALAEIRQSDVPVNEIQLKNLQQQHVHSLVCDALNHPPDCFSLVNLIYEKTLGNAFFLIQFLKNLFEESLLRFNSKVVQWQWDLTEIHEKNISDNVVQLMTAEISRMSPETGNILQLAACIGNRFELAQLAVITGLPATQTARMLEPTLKEGIINPLSGNYRFAGYQDITENVGYQFVHDRVQQAAYGLVSGDKRKQAHLDIANTLLDSLDERQQQNRIFEIVNHINIACELISPADQVKLLVSLNVAAGRKARSTVAYQPALQYFKTAIRYLPENAWDEMFQVTSELYLMASEVAFLTLQYEDMENWLDQVLTHADTPLLQADVYEIRLQAYISQNRLNDAVAASLSALELLGVKLPARPGQLHVLSGLIKTKLALRNKTFDDLRALPEMTDSNKLKIMSLLGLTIPPAYWTSQELVALIVFQMVRESVGYGYSPNTGYAFSWWGITLGGVLGDIDSGYDYGEFGVEIAKSHQLNLQRPLFFQGWITLPFKRPLSESIDILVQAYSLSLEKGDFEYASYALNNHMQALFHCGKPLPELLELMSAAHRDLEKFKVGSSLYWHDIWWQTALNLATDVGQPALLRGDAYNEEENLSQHLKVNDASTLFLMYCAKLMLAVLFNDVESAQQYASKARHYLKGGTGMFAFVLFHQYETLALLFHVNTTKDRHKRKILSSVNKNRKKLRQWAEASPENHLHRLHLVEAEYYHGLEKFDQASRHYELAIEEAHKHGFVHDEALSCELAARFFSKRNQKHLADVYLTQAISNYKFWGAEQKVHHLLNEFSYLKKEASYFQHPERHPELKGFFSSSGSMGAELDLTTLMKAYQAITSAIVLEDLVKILLRNVIENAGAQKGILVLKRDRQLYIEAESMAESHEVMVSRSLPLDEARECLPVSLVHFVERSLESLVLDDTDQYKQFSSDPYLVKNKPRSVLCQPILLQGNLTGVLYLENNLISGAFTREQLELLNFLVAQAAISLENAQLYNQLEDKVYERTIELQASLRTQQELNDELVEKSKKLDDAYEKLQDANEKLQQQANTDALTGLSNRRYLNELLEHEYRRCLRNNQPLSVIMSDIDNFKAYNDHYGHIEGDTCLKQVADVFKEVFHRSTDIIARYGGEEIIAVLPNTELEEVSLLAEKLRTSVENLKIPHTGNTQHKIITISVGICSLVPDISRSIDSITQAADRALYQAKNNGKNRVEISPSV